LYACPKRLGDLSTGGRIACGPGREVHVRIATLDTMENALARSFDTRLKTRERGPDTLPACIRHEEDV
jgi:hypothetical protein